MRIIQASNTDLTVITQMASVLWPDSSPEELEREFKALLNNDECAVFLALVGDDPVGFAQCQLRHDYVEGATTSPVGYLEGIFVRDGRRRQGVARLLLDECERWAAQKGCTEFASDCELDNAESIAFHESCGFTEANRIVCFAKRL